jgi:uncharacterized cupredoxin-like copper-binding protein
MRHKSLLALSALASLTIALTACGGSDNNVAKPNGDHVVEITMKDQRFEPARVEIKAGAEIVFRFTNRGTALHEAYIGTTAQQQAHEHEMTTNGGSMGTSMSATPTTDMSSMSSTSMSGMHGTGTVVEVKPGKSGELRYMTAKAGTLLIGCHQPGHWKAGMQATIKVS